jgi:hypothetical protein
MADPENILPDPGFEGDLSNWAIDGDPVATIAPSGSIVFGGMQSMQVSYSDVGQAAAETVVTGLQVGRAYRVQAWFFCPQGSGSLDPTIRIDWPDEWEVSPQDWVDHIETWKTYDMADTASTLLFGEGVWTLRELVFTAILPGVRIELFNFLTSAPGQSFYVDQVSLAINVPTQASVYCELAGEWTTAPVMNIIGENFGEGMLSYFEVDTYEPDRVTPIDPVTYTGILADYTNYIDIMSNASAVTKVTRIESDGTRAVLQYMMPLSIEHGGFRLIDVEAPLDTSFYYEVILNNGVVMNTLECSIPTTSIAPSFEIRCSAALISDPLSMSLSMWVALLSIDQLSHPGRRELFDVISRRYPISISDVRLTPRTQIRVATFTLDERKLLLNTLATGRILLLRIPDESYPESYWYISVGDVTEERMMRDHRRPERRWLLEVAVVERPYGLVTFNSNRVYNEVLNFEPDGVTPITPQTYQGVILDYADYLSVLIGSNPTASATADPGQFWPGVSTASQNSPWVLST